MTKWKLNLKSIKSFNVSSYYGKNLKVTTIYIINNNSSNNRNNSENESNAYE